MMRLASSAAVLILAVSAGTAWAGPETKMMGTSVGEVMVDAEGMTLYTFDRDEENLSNCYDQCAINWPIYEVSAEAMAEGDWTIVERTDGTKMWAYKGDPLYYYIDDKAPGDVTGDGKGGVWHVIKSGM
jgi:predicted lipoprotein with Yx(FWY)xxD motif